VLATLVQTRAVVHSVQIAEQVTPASPLGRVTDLLQPLLILHGAGPAPLTAIAQGARLVQRHGAMLAIQDAFWLVLLVLLAALVAAGFVQMRRPTPAVAPAVAGGPGRVERREAIVVE